MTTPPQVAVIWMMNHHMCALDNMEGQPGSIALKRSRVRIPPGPPKFTVFSPGGECPDLLTFNVKYSVALFWTKVDGQMSRADMDKCPLWIRTNIRNIIQYSLKALMTTKENNLKVNQHILSIDIVTPMIMYCYTLNDLGASAGSSTHEQC